MTGPELASVLPSMLPRLWAFALRVAASREDAELLVHQACARTLKSGLHLDNGMAPLHCLYSNVCELWTCNDRVSPNPSFPWRTPVGEPRTTEERIVRAVQELPDAYRLVMLLVEAEGLSTIETSAVLRLPEETVLRRLSVARQTIGSTLRMQRGHAFGALAETV